MRLDSHTEFKILERLPKGAEAGRVHITIAVAEGQYFGVPDRKPNNPIAVITLSLTLGLYDLITSQ